MRNMRKRLFFIPLMVVVSVIFNFAAAQDKAYPAPAGNAKQLFYLQRSTNTNTIVYELNNADGAVDKDDPVNVFWIRYDEQGQKEGLSFVQRKFAYGIKSKELSANKYELNVVSIKKYKLYLMLGADKQFHIYADINKKQAILLKIYVEIKGGSAWSPNIEYIEFTGIDPDTNLPVKERFTI